VLESIPCDWKVYLNGWSIETDAPPRAVGIHHPRGDVKKISFINTQLQKKCWPNKDCTAQTHLHITKWTLGTTEPGSSGSVLLDHRKLTIGVLTGGSASCPNANGWDEYGSLEKSFIGGGAVSNSFKFHLDPDATGTKTIEGSYLCNLSAN
jgi:hypothetical protein